MRKILLAVGSLVASSLATVPAHARVDRLDREGRTVFSGEIGDTVEDAVFDVAAPPLITLYLSRDGVTWTANYDWCANGHNFYLTQGKFRVNPNWCSGNAGLRYFKLVVLRD
jgi:hypothetical protein